VATKHQQTKASISFSPSTFLSSIFATQILLYYELAFKDMSNSHQSNILFISNSKTEVSDLSTAEWKSSIIKIPPNSSFCEAQLSG
jgi:hypothetical protein